MINLRSYHNETYHFYSRRIEPAKMNIYKNDYDITTQ